MMELMAILQQLLSPIANKAPLNVANTDSSSSGPFDRRERGPQRLDFAAVVERPAPDQQVGDARALRALDVQAASCPARS